MSNLNLETEESPQEEPLGEEEWRVTLRRAKEEADAELRRIHREAREQAANRLNE